MGAAVTRLPDIRVPDTKVSLQPACGCSHRSLRVAKSRQSRSARSAVAPLIPLLPAGGLCLVLLLATVAQAHGLRWPGEAAQDTTTAHPVPRPGYLGVSLRDLDATETTRLRTHASGQTLPDGGAMIVTVDRDAPAWSAGLRPRDIVLEVNGQSVSDVEVLRRKLRICGTGDALTLRVWRAGHEMTVSVVLGDQDAIAHNAMSLHLRPTAEPDAQAFTDVTPMPTGIAAAASSQPPPGVAHTALYRARGDAVDTATGAVLWRTPARRPTGNGGQYWLAGRAGRAGRRGCDRARRLSADHHAKQSGKGIPPCTWRCSTAGGPAQPAGDDGSSATGEAALNR
jgi:hypothetical protein